MTEPLETPWDGGWEAHGRAQRRAWGMATPAQRLAWLESANEFVREHARTEDLRHLLAEMRAENGSPDEEEEAWARHVLGL